jgi:hypothetical protein
MAVVSYDKDPSNPSNVLLGDENGRQFSVPATDASNYATLPTRSTWMTGGDVQTPASSQPAVAPAPMTPAAQAVLNKRDQVLPGTPGARMVKTGTQSTTNTVYGRDENVVNKQIAEEQAAGATQDQAILDAAAARDANTEAGFRARQQGVQQLAGNDVNKGFDIKRQAQEVNTQKQKLEADLKANDESFDANRLVNNMSTGKKIGMILLAALQGAFNNVLGRQGNEVLDVINQQIATDIQAQKDAIKAGHDRVGNQLQELVRKGYDLEQAEKILYDRLQGGVAKMAEIEADRIGAKGQNLENAKQLVAGLGQQRLARKNDLIASTEDRRQTSSTSTFQSTEGGRSDTGSEIKYLELRDKLLNAKSAEEVGTAIGRPVSFEEANKIRENGEQYANKRANNATSQQTVDALAAAVGAVKGKDGKWTLPPSGKVDPGVRPAGLSFLSNEKARQVDRLWSQMKEAKVMNMSREPSNSLQSEFGDAIDRPFYDDEIPNVLNTIQDRIDSSNNQLDQGYGKDVVNYFNKQPVSATPSLGVR